MIVNINHYTTRIQSYVAVQKLWTKNDENNFWLSSNIYLIIFFPMFLFDHLKTSENQKGTWEERG